MRSPNLLYDISGDAVHRLNGGRCHRPIRSGTRVIAGPPRAPGMEQCCTHRPSLLPIEWLSEAFGLAQRGRQRPLRAGKLVKLGHLEEVKVVTRFSIRRGNTRVNLSDSWSGDCKEADPRRFAPPGAGHSSNGDIIILWECSPSLERMPRGHSRGSQAK